VNIIGPSLQREAECEQVLRSLPQWFGIEEALLMYARDSATLPTFAVESEARIIGFVSLQQHFPMSWEVHCIAVAAEARNAGHGTRLLEHAEQWLSQRGARFLQIKTVAAGSPSPEYAESRAFYAARGYLPLEMFPMLWSARNPALQLVKSLPASATEVYERPAVKNKAEMAGLLLRFEQDVTGDPGG
jgi:GNAT superfamily N-acetyltransferase